MGDENDEIDQRLKITNGMQRDIIRKLQTFLHQHNQLVSLFKYAIERMPSNEYKIVIKADKLPCDVHKKRLNTPSVNEIAIIMVNDEKNSRDIVIQKKNDTLQRVNETHRSYDAMQYPLLFWQGEDGYHFNLKQYDRKKDIEMSKKVMKY